MSVLWIEGMCFAGPMGKESDSVSRLLNVKYSFVCFFAASVTKLDFLKAFVTLLSNKISKK